MRVIDATDVGMRRGWRNNGLKARYISLISKEETVKCSYDSSNISL